MPAQRWKSGGGGHESDEIDWEWEGKCCVSWAHHSKHILGKWQNQNGGDSRKFCPQISCFDRFWYPVCLGSRILRSTRDLNSLEQWRWGSLTYQPSLSLWNLLKKMPPPHVKIKAIICAVVWIMFPQSSCVAKLISQFVSWWLWSWSLG